MKKSKNLSNITIFMIGIGGISMSGLAKILIHRGCRVIGSDLNYSQNVRVLESLGVKIYREHSENNINKDIDLVVYSGAIKSDNREILCAKKLKIPVIERCKLLGEIAKTFENVISIAGTHGKTTTASIISHIFSFTGLNPTIHLGGECNNFESSTVIGGDKYFIVESCEYRNSFKYLRPQISAILNIEEDHLDYYKNLKHIYKCFAKFAKNSKSLIKLKDVNIKHKNCETIGTDWKVLNVVGKSDCTQFDVYYKCVFWGTFVVNMLGSHNVQNSLFAIAICNNFGISKEQIYEGLKTFQGVKRRYETIGNISDKPVIIDYAHHPTAIEKSVNGLIKKYHKIMCIFQPHTYSRTKTLMSDFVAVLSKLENITIYKTFPAREEEIIGGRCIDLYNNIENGDKKYFDKLSDIISFIKSSIHNYDAVLIMGAGDLGEIIKKYLD